MHFRNQNDSEYAQRRYALLLTTAFLASTSTLLGSCVSESESMKLRANALRARITSVQGNFEAEISSFCEEVPSAQTPVTPPFGKVCSRGCTCAGTSSGNERPESTYDCSAWDTPEWKRLRFAGSYSRDGKVWPTVYFHHQANWRRTEVGCRLDFTVYGDLDEDGVYSTYTSTIEVGSDGTIGNRPDDSLLLE